MNDLAEAIVTLIENEITTRGDEPIDCSTDLLLSGIVDSLGVVRIVHWLEERLQIVIDASDVTLDNFQTVDAIIGYVAQRQGAAA